VADPGSANVLVVRKAPDLRGLSLWLIAWAWVFFEAVPFFDTAASANGKRSPTKRRSPQRRSPQRRSPQRRRRSAPATG
jgi:hypothetical protein